MSADGILLLTPVRGLVCVFFVILCLPLDLTVTVPRLGTWIRIKHHPCSVEQAWMVKMDSLIFQTAHSLPPLCVCACCRHFIILTKDIPSVVQGTLLSNPCTRTVMVILPCVASQCRNSSNHPRKAEGTTCQSLVAPDWN